MSAEEGFVTTGEGLRLFYRKLGTGPIVLIPNGIYLFDDFRHLADTRTLLFYDVRNRGYSDGVRDEERLTGGVNNDVDDLESVRKHFAIDRLDLIGHSYIALVIALYALKYQGCLRRMILIGPIQPFAGKKYPPHLAGSDGTLDRVLAKIEQLRNQQSSDNPQEQCRKVWDLLRVIHVADEADVDKIKWDRCNLPNELNFRSYWATYILPSIERLALTHKLLKTIDSPTLIVHGAKDRSSPYGGGRDWASSLSNARLLTVECAAHAPWIEAPKIVYESMNTFLAGSWPDAAEKISCV